MNNRNWFRCRGKWFIMLFTFTILLIYQFFIAFFLVTRFSIFILFLFLILVLFCIFRIIW